MLKRLHLRKFLAGRRVLLPIMALALELAACSTSLDDKSGGSRRAGSSNSPGTDPASTVSPVNGDPNAPPTNVVVTPTTGSARGVLRLVTNEEYRNTVRDLLNLSTVPTGTLQSESRSESYKNFADALSVSNTLGGQYANLAKRVAAEITDFQALAPCAQSTAPRECATAFLRSFGKRAFRRPLTDAELEGYLQMFGGELTRTSYNEGIRLMVEDFLQSPNLLYRFELGTPAGNTRVLDSYETATLLSYMLSTTAPDPELLAAADAKALGPAERESQARRLLTLQPAKDAVRSFVRQWTQIDAIASINKDADIYPTFTPELWTSMLAETDRFIDSVIWEGDGSFKTLMTSSNSFADGPLAAHYGTTTNSPTGTLVPVALDPSQRMGLLTQGSVLGSHSKAGESFPIGRGKLVRERLLCQKLQPPPAALNIVPVAADPNRTARERFEAHSSNPACAGCHSLIDPVGFGLESYDGVGQFRTMDNGKPINAAGMLTATRDIDGPFTGVELSQKLSTSKEAQDCFSLQAMVWAFGRFTLKNDTDRALATAITTQMPTGLDVKEALIAIIKSDSFTTRSAQ